MAILILLISAIVGGHLVRRATPYLLQMKDTSMPFKYPVVEAVAVVVFMVIYASLGVGLPQISWYLFALLLLAVGAADAYTKYIPSLLCYAGTFFGLALNLMFPERIISLLDQYNLLQLVGASMYDTHVAGITLAGMGAIMGFVEIHFIRKVFKPLVNVEVMGSGDATLMLMIGAFIGPRAVLYCMLPACLVGIIIGGFVKLVHGKPHVAFGPALAIGSLLILLYSHLMVGGVQQFYQMIYNLPPMVPLAIAVGLVLLLLLMLLRLRRKAAEYEQIMDEEYAETDKKMQEQ